MASLFNKPAHLYSNLTTGDWYRGKRRLGITKLQTFARKMYSATKHRGEVEFDDQFLYELIIQGSCYHCQRNLDLEGLNIAQNPDKPSVERLNNDVGYTKANTVISCQFCNIARKRASLNNWKLVVELIFRQAHEVYTDMFTQYTDVKLGMIQFSETYYPNLSVYWVKEQWIRQRGLCYYSGLPMKPYTLERRKTDPFLVNIECLDAFGLREAMHTPDNCVLVCAFMNHGRQAYPYDKWCEWLKLNVFKPPETFYEMIAIEDMPPPITCPQCGYNVSRRNALTTHIAKVHTRTHVCQECNKSFASPTSLQTHLNQHRGVKFECHVCNTKFSHESTLDNHLMKDHRVYGIKYKYKCDNCFRAYSLHGMLVRHLQNKHNIEIDAMYVESRKKQFKEKESSNNVNEEKESKTDNERVYACSECKKVYTAPRPLLLHEMKHHSKYPENYTFKCYSCYMAYCNAESLRDHMDVEHLNKKRDFKCDECDKVFTSKSGSNKHKKKVHMNITHVCKECNQVFKKKDSLNKHLMTVHQVYYPKFKFKCDRCRMAYTTSKALEGHIKKDHAKDGFTCDECKLEFNTEKTFNRHLIDEHSIYPKGYDYRCDQCHSAFTRIDNLKLHIANKHT